MQARITKHGEDRQLQRVGGSKKNIDKYIAKALEHGITHAQATGRLKKYFASLYFMHETANNIRIYNRKVYIFNNNTFVTVFSLPNNLYVLEDSLKTKIN